MIRLMNTTCLILMFAIVVLCIGAPDLYAQGSEKKYTEEQYQQALNQLDHRPLDPSVDLDGCARGQLRGGK